MNLSTQSGIDPTTRNTIMIKFKRFAVLALATALSTTAFAMGPTGTAADYGVPVTGVASDRTIIVKPSTRSVSVVNGETVNFVIDGKSYSWHVDTYPNVNEFDLEKIVPAGAGVRIFVSPNPLYLGA
jgi:hypothetical protein